MTYLLLQTFLLLLSSYFFGALVACLAKRAMQTASPGLPATSSTATAVTVKARDTAPVIPVAPRAFDPVQPKIDVLSRPEPKAAPPIADTSRFDRALGTALTASANVPRKSVVEIRPAVLKSPTGPAVIPAARTAPAAPVKPTPAPPAQTPKAAPAPPVQPPRPAATVTPPAPPKPPVPVPAQAAPQPAPQQQSVPQAAASAAAAAAAAVAAAKAAAAAVTPVKTSPPPQPAPPPTATVTVAPAAPPKPAPAAPPKTAPAAPPVTPPPPPAKPSTAALAGDDFQRIRAIDEDTERRLKSGGVTRFEDMARWTPSDVQKINQALDLNGRIDREQWVEQAQILAKGGETYYSRNRSQNPRSGDAAPDQPMRPATPAAPAASPTPSAPASAAQSVPQMSVPQMSTSSSATQAAAAAAAAAATIRSNQPAPPAAPPPAPTPATSSSSKPAPAPASATASPTPASPPQRSVSEMASAAAIAIAAASASVTRGMRPIEPISPLSKVDPNQSRPARLQDAIKEQETKAPSSSGPAFPLSGAAAPSVGRDFNHLRSVRSESLRSADFDDLKRIRGIGVLIEKRLNTLGVTSYNQIANWTNADIDRVSQTLDFKGRIERENWVEQARILSSGGHTEFSRRVDRGDVDSSRDS